MSNTRLMLILILVQQGMMGVTWLGAALLGLARSPARHWGMSALMLAACLALVSLREGGLSPWLGVVVANTLGVTSQVLLRRGVQRFCGRPVTDGQHLVLILGTGIALAIGLLWQAPFWMLASVTSLAVAWCLLGAAGEIARDLRPELGQRVALACAAPLLALGMMFAVRAAIASTLVGNALPLSGEGSQAAAFGIAVLSVALLQHLALGAMVVTRTVRQLRRLSDHDALTGVLNRRGLSERHQRARGRHDDGAGSALLVIDIDHFKRVNDAHGHEAGDAALVAMARTLQQQVRATDLVARTGGEEFCVLMPGIDAASAHAIAERIRRSVRDTVVDAGPASLRLSCSIGVAWTADAGVPLESLVARADAAMYNAKAAGRDRVEPALAA